MGADICGDKLCGIRDHNVLEQLPGEFTSFAFLPSSADSLSRPSKTISSQSLFYHVSFLSLSLNITFWLL